MVSTVSDEPLIKADLKCRDLVDEAKNYLLLPSERADRQGIRTKARVPSQYGQLLYAGNYQLWFACFLKTCINLIF